MAPKAASASAMSRIISAFVSGWRTRTPISSWAIRAAQFRLVDACGGIMTRVKAKLLIAIPSYELSSGGVIPLSIDARPRLHDAIGSIHEGEAAATAI